MQKYWLSRIIKKATKIEPQELKATLLSFSFIFLLMFAYNILKPVRDAMAPEWTDVEVAWLWTLNFLFSVIAVSLYGLAVSKLKLKNVIPGVYVFFAMSFLIFYIFSDLSSNNILVNKAFYVWLSLFSLFHISVFWSLMSDLFSQVQASRLFAFISSGASVGTICGATFTLMLADNLGTLNLMLVASVILLLIVPLISYLKHSISEDGQHLNQEVTIGTNPFAGFIKFINNPYLLGIALFIFLYTFIGSFAYFEIKNLMMENDRITNTEIWAAINLTVNSISIVTAMFITSRITQYLGMGKTLFLVPFLVSIGLMVVFVNPILATIIITWVLLKAGNYSITRPGREMLFTSVGREDRFKTKQVIDIVVYRGGDVFSGWMFAFLTAILGLGMAVIAIIGTIVALFWGYVGLRLGKRHDSATPITQDSIEITS